MAVTANEISLFEVLLDIKEMKARRLADAGDELWVSIQPSTMTGTFTLTTSHATYTKWVDGGHI
jgi:hypothetical protein